MCSSPPLSWLARPRARYTIVVSAIVYRSKYKGAAPIEAKTLGDRIQSLLKEQGISRKQFATMTGLTEAAISRYCTGAREPKSVTLATIANALGVSVDELLGTPCDDPETLEGAMRLVARSAKEIPDDKKRELISALLDFAH